MKKKIKSSLNHLEANSYILLSHAKDINVCVALFNCAYMYFQNAFVSIFLIYLTLKWKSH
jgi:hypothetical protein